MITPNNDEVICPGCAHQFRAIPVNVQAELAAARNATLTEGMALDTLRSLVRKVHAAKGRHHTQIAMCDLYDAVGLENTRPVKVERRTTDVFPMDALLASHDISVAQLQTGSGITDPLYSEAVALCLAHNKGSISLVQRHLRIGYNRAACMLDAMHAAGVLAPLPTGGYAVVPQVDRKRPDDTEGGAI